MIAAIYAALIYFAVAFILLCPFLSNARKSCKDTNISHGAKTAPGDGVDQYVMLRGGK